MRMNTDECLCQASTYKGYVATGRLDQDVSATKVFIG